MSRYISIESAAKAFSFHTVNTYENCMEMIRDSLLRGDIELANVREVKYGKWKDVIGYDPKKKVQCQNCYLMNYEPTVYCPHCCAKMDWSDTE